METKELIENAIRFHGHICAGLAIGVLAVKYVLEHGFNYSPNEKVVAVVENDTCSIDALQALLPAETVPLTRAARSGMLPRSFPVPSILSMLGATSTIFCSSNLLSRKQLAVSRRSELGWPAEKRRAEGHLISLFGETEGYSTSGSSRG